MSLITKERKNNKQKQITLHSAIRNGYFQQVRYILELGDNVNNRDEEGRTCLMLCGLIEEDDWGVGIARTLLEKGARVDLRDKNGRNAFHYACLYQRRHLVLTFLDAVDFNLNQTDKCGNTALHYLAAVGNADMTNILIEALNKYKLSVDKKNKQGITPLIQAYKCGHISCANLLLSLGNANEDVKDEIELKTAKEWREEVIEKEKKRLLTPKISAGPRYMRVSSAPPRRRHSLAPEQIAVTLPTEKDKNILIKSASLTDLRNNPQYVFKVKPTDFFNKENNLHLLSQRPKSCDYKRLLERRNQQNKSWRPEFKFLYHEFEYQCSPSYCDSAQQCLHDSLDNTPPPSEYGAEGERPGNGQKRDSKLRKQSQSRPPSALERRSLSKLEASKSRRNSILSPTSSECSMKTTKKKTRSISSDIISYAGTTEGTEEIQEELVKGLPPRPVSRATVHKHTTWT